MELDKIETSVCCYNRENKDLSYSGSSVELNVMGNKSDAVDSSLKCMLDRTNRLIVSLQQIRLFCGIQMEQEGILGHEQ